MIMARRYGFYGPFHYCGAYQICQHRMEESEVAKLVWGLSDGALSVSCVFCVSRLCLCVCAIIMSPCVYSARRIPCTRIYRWYHPCADRKRLANKHGIFLNHRRPHASLFVLKQSNTQTIMVWAFAWSGVLWCKVDNFDNHNGKTVARHFSRNWSWLLFVACTHFWWSGRASHHNPHTQ